MGLINGRFWLDATRCDGWRTGASERARLIGDGAGMGPRVFIGHSQSAALVGHGGGCPSTAGPRAGLGRGGHHKAAARRQAAALAAGRPARPGRQAGEARQARPGRRGRQAARRGAPTRPDATGCTARNEERRGLGARRATAGVPNPDFAARRGRPGRAGQGRVGIVIYGACAPAAAAGAVATLRVSTAQYRRPAHDGRRRLPAGGLLERNNSSFVGGCVADASRARARAARAATEQRFTAACCLLMMMKWRGRRRGPFDG